MMIHEDYLFCPSINPKNEPPMNFFDIIDTMSIDEMRARLADYMAKDEQYAAHPIAVEVRLSGTNCTRCRYEVMLIDEEGNEIPVLFHDRYSRLVYIYTLMHPKGFQRYSVAANNYHELRRLYSKLYFKDSDALLKTIDSTDIKKPGQFLSQYITQSRDAIRKASPLAKQLIIDRPQSHNGRVLIPFVANGGTVILDDSLCNNMYNL